MLEVRTELEKAGLVFLKEPKDILYSFPETLDFNEDGKIWGEQEKQLMCLYGDNDMMFLKIITLYVIEALLGLPRRVKVICGTEKSWNYGWIDAPSTAGVGSDEGFLNNIYHELVDEEQMWLWEEGILGRYTTVPENLFPAYGKRSSLKARTKRLWQEYIGARTADDGSWDW